jgi:2-keto-3-deoxy-6-phosphogluconate aldolase
MKPHPPSSDDVLDAVTAGAVMAKLTSASHLLHSSKYMAKLSTGCPLINECLAGGVPSTGITEVCEFGVKRA